MATKLELAEVARSTDWQRRVKVAMQDAAAKIKAEDTTTDPTYNEGRQLYADDVLGGFASVHEMGLAVLTTETIAGAVLPPDGANISDNDIQTAVNSLWDAFSGWKNILPRNRGEIAPSAAAARV